MNRIDLTKYGFVRCKENDFSDDGLRYACYRVGDIRVYKASYDGDVFITGIYAGTNPLPHDEYTKLPHYRALNCLRCVNKSYLTEDSLKRFYSDCLAYDTEYKDAKSKTVYPTMDEIIKSFKIRSNMRQAELTDLETKLSAHLPDIFSLSDYKLKELKKHYNLLKSFANPEMSAEEYAAKIKGTTFSKQYMSSEAITYDTQPNWAYKRALEILSEVGIK